MVTWKLNPNEAAALERRAIQQMADVAVGILRRYPKIEGRHFLQELLLHGYTVTEVNRLVQAHNRFNNYLAEHYG